MAEEKIGNKEIRYRAVYKGKMCPVVEIGWKYGKIFDCTVELTKPNGKTVLVVVGNALIEELLIMQYTGLKDKNGKEIYEGDVIFHERLNLDGEPIKCYKPVRWDNEFAGWWAVNDDLPSLLSEEVGGFVLGNIFENPELNN